MTEVYAIIVSDHFVTALIMINKFKKLNLPYTNFRSKFWKFLKFVGSTNPNRFALLPIRRFIAFFLIKFSVTANCNSGIRFCQGLIKRLFSCPFVTTQIPSTRSWKKWIYNQSPDKTRKAKQKLYILLKLLLLTRSFH